MASFLKIDGGFLARDTTITNLTKARADDTITVFGFATGRDP